MSGRRFIPGLTALMVLYTAMFCACPQAAMAAATTDAAAPAAHEGCAGHESSDQPAGTQQPHDHDGRCDCSDAPGVLEAPPAPTVSPPLPIVLPPAAGSLLDRLLAEPPAEATAALDADEDHEPPGPGAGGTLLRQRCALNL